MEHSRLLHCYIWVRFIIKYELYSIIELLAYDINLKALRILRVIRPLRSIKASPSMRRQVTTLL